MEGLAGVANRHSLPVAGLGNMGDKPPFFVRIIVSDDWAATHSGQLLTACLVNLLVRQVGIVDHIEFQSTSCDALIHPPGEPQSTFPDCILSLSSWAVDGAVTLSGTHSKHEADHTIVIGGKGLQTEHHKGVVSAVVGMDWRAWIGHPENAPTVDCSSSNNPLGPFLAAALAAGEVFKRNLGLLRGDYLTENGYSLWSGGTSTIWDGLASGPEVAGHALSPIHIAGLGAVGNALAYVIANLNLSDTYVVLLDDDHYDETNLNRCLLAGWSDRGGSKVTAVEEYLRRSGVGVYPYRGTVQSYPVDEKNGLRPDVARDVENLRFEIVASCVDRNISRQAIQGLNPLLSLGGSTLDLQAKAYLYSARPDGPCLACFNPKERDGDKIRAFEAELRNLSSDERQLFLESRGLDPIAIEEYLSGVVCGGIGESALKEFATQPPPQFSAGFVSLGSGLLVASALLKKTVYQDAAWFGDECTLNFRNGGLLGCSRPTDPNCEMSVSHFT